MLRAGLNPCRLAKKIIPIIAVLLFIIFVPDVTLFIPKRVTPILFRG
jgi:hypothetical protein